LLRDALINEQWEGPRNLLLNQIHADLGRVADWYPAAECARDLAAGGPEAGDDAPADAVERLVATEIFDRPADPATVADARAWDERMTDLFRGYQDAALAEVLTGA
ncbi:MAG: acyl-CoA dehydrogenase, partial [Gammaproteobacteria bacterium]